MTKPKNMGFEEFKKIIDNFPFLLEIRLNGLGEPLMDPELGKIIKYCNGKKITTTFNSNATLLTEKKGKELIESGLTIIVFSIDGATKKTFESIRKGANFEKVIANIEKFIKLRNRMDSKTPQVYIVTVQMKKNQNEIKKIEKLAKKLGANYYKTNYLNYFFDNKTLKEQRISSKEKPEFNCRWPWNSIYVNLNGDVSPCCHGAHFKLGNVFEEGANVWNSKKYKEFRKYTRTGNNEYCKRCPEYDLKSNGNLKTFKENF